MMFKKEVDNSFNKKQRIGLMNLKIKFYYKNIFNE